jgi:hypothetical protein
MVNKIKSAGNVFLIIIKFNRIWGGMMKKSRFLFVISLVSIILMLAMIGGNWTPTYAEDTVPKGGGGGGEGGGGTGVCGPSSIPVSPPKEGEVGCLPWQLFNPIAGVCNEGMVVVWELPITGDHANPPPYWWKMIHYSDAFEVHYYVNGQKVDTLSCAMHDIRFYLNSWQRQVYDKTPDTEQIYRLNMTTNIWELCPTSLDTTIGAHGILVCHMTDWGFYSLGHPGSTNQ